MHGSMLCRAAPASPYVAKPHLAAPRHRQTIGGSPATPSNPPPTLCAFPLASNNAIISEKGVCSPHGCVASINVKWCRLRVERHPEESAKAFHAFCLYKDAGSERSLTHVAQMLHVSKQAIGRWSSQHRWVGRALAWDNYQAQQINSALMSDLIKQARQLQQRTNEALESLASGSMEGTSIAEICLMLKTLSGLAEGSHGVLHEMISPASMSAPVFNIVMYSKPDDHVWCRHQDDPEARGGFHIPQEIASQFKQTFPEYFLVM